MRKNRKEFELIELYKERQKLRILEQEKRVRSDFKELSDNLTGAALIDKVKENLFSGSGLALKMGFLAATLITERVRSKRKHKK